MIPEGADLKDVFEFAYGDYVRGMPKKTERQLIYLHGNDEDPSYAEAERPVSAKGRPSETDSRENPLANCDLVSRDVEIVEDY